MQKYRFHWLSGPPEDGVGVSPEDAFTRLGYGGGAIAALDYYECLGDCNEGSDCDE